MGKDICNLGVVLVVKDCQELNIVTHICDVRCKCSDFNLSHISRVIVWKGLKVKENMHNCPQRGWWEILCRYYL